MELYFFVGHAVCGQRRGFVQSQLDDIYAQLQHERKANRKPCVGYWKISVIGYYSVAYRIVYSDHLRCQQEN